MKKLLFILFCLGLFLLAGQTALAANTPACIAISGTCQNITCTDTATPGDNNYTLDSAFFTTDPAAATHKATCITEFQGTTKTCTTGKCEGAWYNVCCKTKTACSNCVATADCAAADQTTDTCSEAGKVCCKPKCAADMCKESCTGSFKADTSKSVADCPAGKKICCKVESSGGDNQPPAGGGTTESASFPLAPLSPIGDIDIATLIGLIIKGVLGIVGSIALLMFVYGGFLMLVSQGDAAKVKKGKDALIWAAAGLVVIFGSYIFVSFILAGLSGNGGT
jgi:hypothetical protein